MTIKLYLYKLLSREVNISETEGVTPSFEWDLLALDRKVWRSNHLHSLESKYMLKPFEVNQNDFDILISFSNDLNVHVLDIEFTEELSPDENNELHQLIKEHNVDKILEFINNQRYEHQNDIETVTYRHNSIPGYHLINFSRDAVLTLENTDNYVRNILSTQPIGVLSGKFLPSIPSFREGDSI